MEIDAIQIERVHEWTPKRFVTPTVPDAKRKRWIVVLEFKNEAEAQTFAETLYKEIETCQMKA